MSNTGKLGLELNDVENHPVIDDDVRVRLVADGRPILDRRGIRFGTAGGKVTFAGVPAFPQAKLLHGRVTLSRYRSRPIPFFPLTHGQTHSVALQVVRQADEWQASFTPWDELSGRFRSLQRVLDASPDLKVPGGRRFGSLTRAEYDSVAGTGAEALAKACLLNLHHKMSGLTDPTTGGRRWFTYLDRILELRRDRLIGIAQPAMGDSIRAIKANIAAIPGYRNEGAAHHHGNLPLDRYEAAAGDMFGIKSSEEKGNVQFSMAPAVDRETGDRVLLIDADIDEDGTFFGHLLEVFEHKVTGKKTHPFDVREIFGASDPGFDAGYRLV